MHVWAPWVIVCKPKLFGEYIFWGIQRFGDAKKNSGTQKTFFGTQKAVLRGTKLFC